MSPIKINPIWLTFKRPNRKEFLIQKITGKAKKINALVFVIATFLISPERWQPTVPTHNLPSKKHGKIFASGQNINNNKVYHSISELEDKAKINTTIRVFHAK